MNHRHVDGAGDGLDYRKIWSYIVDHACKSYFWWFGQALFHVSVLVSVWSKWGQTSVYGVAVSHVCD